ncbi:TPA: MFS transporter, partial [Enterococcus faecium]
MLKKIFRRKKDESNKKRWILIAIYLATFMTAFETTIVITAANAIANSFGREIPIALLFSSYLFSSALSTPVFSRLADQYGKKPIFIIGLLLFMTGTFLCGISQSFFILVFFRMVQGIGAGGIVPITFSLIGNLFDYESRGRIMGLNNSAWGIASLAAPLLGGLLVENFSWHCVFFINIPVGLITILILLLFYDEEKRPSVSFSYQELGQYLFLITVLFL